MTLKNIIAGFSYSAVLTTAIFANSVFAQEKKIIPGVEDSKTELNQNSDKNSNSSLKKNSKKRKEDSLKGVNPNLNPESDLSSDSNSDLNSDLFYTPPYRIELEDKTYFITDIKRKGANFVINSKGTPVGFFKSKTNDLEIGGEDLFVKLPVGEQKMSPVLADDPLGWWGWDDDNAPSLDEIIKSEIKTPFDVPEDEWKGKVFLNSKKILKDNIGPDFEIIERELLESTGFLIERIGFNVKMGEPFVTYTIIDSLETKKRLTKSLNPILITRFDPYLREGLNKIKIIASDYAGNKTTKFISINRGGEIENLEGIDFIMPNIIHRNFTKDLELYVSLLAEIKSHNHRASFLNRVNQVFILNYSSHNTIGKSKPVLNGWYDQEVGRITLGYGFFKVSDPKRNLRDLFLHEVGHKIFHNLKTTNLALFRDINIVFELEAPYGFGFSIQSRFFQAFTDSEYCGIPLMGHPQDNASELFASSYSIYRAYNSELKSKLNNLPPSVKIRAKRMYDLLSKVKENSDLRLVDDAEKKLRIWAELKFKNFM